MSFFRTLLRPDHDDNPERSLVANQVFQSFMIHGRLPPWGRHYARQILTLDDQGRLQEDDDSYHRYDKDFSRTRLAGGSRRFIVAMTVVVGVIGGGLAAAHNVARCGATVLPPCFDQSEQTAGQDSEYQR
jgi:hypothetical protein